MFGIYSFGIIQEGTSMINKLHNGCNSQREHGLWMSIFIIVVHCCYQCLVTNCKMQGSVHGMVMVLSIRQNHFTWLLDTRQVASGKQDVLGYRITWGFPPPITGTYHSAATGGRGSRYAVAQTRMAVTVHIPPSPSTHTYAKVDML